MAMNMGSQARRREAACNLAKMNSPSLVAADCQAPFRKLNCFDLIQLQNSVLCVVRNSCYASARSSLMEPQNALQDQCQIWGLFRSNQNRRLCWTNQSWVHLDIACAGSLPRGSFREAKIHQGCCLEFQMMFLALERKKEKPGLESQLLQSSNSNEKAMRFPLLFATWLPLRINAVRIDNCVAQFHQA